MLLFALKVCYNRTMAIKKFLSKLKVHFGKVSAIMIAVFVVLLAVDLILKHCEEAYDWNFTVIPRLIWVESGYRNTGAAFSFLADTEWGKAFLIILTLIMIAIMCACFLFLPERFILLKLALAMIISGALGNLVDRIAFGYVRDFVWVNMFFSQACCNFADFWIVFGVIIALVDSLFLNEWAIIPLTAKAKAAQAAARNHSESQEKTGGGQSDKTGGAPTDANKTDKGDGSDGKEGK